MRVSEPEPDYGSPDPVDPGDQGDQDSAMDPDPFDDYAPQESQSRNRVSPRRKSFGRIDQEEEGEEEEEEEEEPIHETPSKKAKGKRKAEEPDQDVEDEIAQELANIDSGLDSDNDEEVERPRPSPLKKAKSHQNPSKTQSRSKTKKENREPPREGVRRSQREHYRPLEYWRGERLVYGRTRNSGPILVPQIKEIIRIPKEVPVPLGAKRKRSATARPRSHSRALEAAEDSIPPALPVVNPEEGWDDNTEAKCTVIHFTTKEEVERR
jgi:centromere protein C